MENSRKEREMVVENFENSRGRTFWGKFKAGIGKASKAEGPMAPKFKQLMGHF